jgi:hypothetical protein
MVVSYVATPDAGAGVRGVLGMIIAATMSCYVVAGGEPTRTLARDAIARNQINTSPTDYASLGAVRLFAERQVGTDCCLK